MTLEEYLRTNDLTHAAFAKTISVSGESVRRYAKCGRVPRPDVMAKIKLATDGQVAPDSFYEGAN